MSNCCRCVSSHPDFPDTVTVNQTVFQIDSDTTVMKKEDLTFSSRLATLTYTPATLWWFNLYRNGVFQNNPDDYVLIGNQVRLSYDPRAGDLFECQYLAAVEGGLPVTAGEGVPVGFITALMQLSLPTGWLLCDGSAVSKTTYSDLWAAIGHTYANDGADEIALDGTGEFRLPNTTVPFYDGTMLVTKSAIIKY